VYQPQQPYGGSRMNISYFEPLFWAFRHMKTSLFQPFNIGKWFAVGFSAFLAGLLDGWGNGGDWKWEKKDFDIDQIADLPYIIREWIIENFEWTLLIILGVIFLIMLLILLNFLSSRGKFLFLENVVQNNRLIKKPWFEYGTEADSLFIWRIIYGVFALAAILGIIFYAIYYFQELSTLTLIGLGFLLLFTFIVCGYISLFLNDFIVPIMYKHRISASKAWLKFILLFNETPLPFILYGLLIFALIIMVIIGVIIIGFLTCCIGFVLIAIPYIGSVVLLPVSYTFRAYSVAFLGQFGSQYTLFPEDTQADKGFYA
jgi:hypothetical protein